MASRSESMSAISNPFAKDNNLRIFFPNDDLAMKAILSPPHLRASSSTGKLETGSTTTTTVATRDNKETTNIFEQGAKLLLRGVTAGVNTVAGGGGSGNGNGGSGSTHKASSGSIAEEDLDRLNNSVLVSHPTLPPPPFANMFACDNCREDIGTLLSKGRHHCRNCGGSFCSDCSSKTIVVPFQVYLSRGEQRVCDGCYHRIKDFQSQAQSTNVTWSGHQPPGNDVVRQEFELDENEEPVTIFNCSLFMDFTPFYGHLFLTREHLCFKGYKGHKIKIPFAKIVSLIKPQFYYINALQVKTRRKEKFFFAEFNGLRDLCFLRMDQLIRAYQEGKKQFVVQVNADDLVQHATVRRKSYKKLRDDEYAQQCEIADSDTDALPKSTSLLSPPNRDDLDNFLSGKSTVGFIDMDRESDLDDNDSNLDSSCRSRVLEDEEDQCTEDTKSCATDEEPSEPLPPDVSLTKTTVLLDCELRTDIKTAFELLWNDGIGQSFLYGTMERARDIDIRISEWRSIDPDAPVAETEAINKGFVISKENDYTLHRTVTSQHPPKITFPGLPPYATCNRVQRFRVNKSTSMNGERWDRFIISDIHRMTKIPFSDYFEIETRWVFSRGGKHQCRVQAGLIVNFLKSTWFKSQINSSTMSESKEVLDSWAKQATEHLRIHAHTSTSAPPSRRSVSGSLSNGAATVDAMTGATDNVGNNEAKSRSPSVKGDSP
uniref:FYVE-type domain-containing protein n=1 Tax=Globisporangium ultimum (strain ATCC 200006 / CBS 805.95 / DAOM BR144) TaxID=431595 RepID=K3WT59_GLOUD